MAPTKSISDKDLNGRKVLNLGDGIAAGDGVNRGQLDANATGDRSRANHSGTQVAATISDFDTAARANRLDQFTAPIAPVAFGAQRATGLADPAAAQDAATKAYVDSQLSGVASGLSTKGSVRAAATDNVTIASPGTTVNGITAAVGDVYLLAGQTTGSQNGPYIFNGSGVAMTRAANWDTDAEAALGSFWIVREGTNADRFAILTNDVAITLGTTVPAFTFTPISGGGGGSANGFAATCPAVAAGAAWTETHNLGTRDLLATFKRAGSPWDELGVRVEFPTINTVSVLSDLALASGEYRITLMRPTF